MTSTRSTSVTFLSPFTLPGLDRDYPAGSYVVRIDEEPVDVSFSASRRVATTIMLSSGAMTQAWPITPTELDAALAKDAASQKPGESSHG